MKPIPQVKRIPRRASEDGLLQRDVAAMLRDYPDDLSYGTEASMELAHDLIVVIRERVLRELESYARENIR